MPCAPDSPISHTCFLSSGSIGLPWLIQTLGRVSGSGSGVPTVTVSASTPQMLMSAVPLALATNTSRTREPQLSLPTVNPMHAQPPPYPLPVRPDLL